MFRKQDGIEKSKPSAENGRYVLYWIFVAHTDFCSVQLML